MAMFPGAVPSNVVTQNATTSALEVNGVAVTGATEYTLTQFLQLDVADYPNYTILISDIPTPHSTVNGVLVRANSAGTAWIWTETMSLTVAQIASYGITALIASGWRIFISDIGQRGSYWYSNGTRFNLDQESVLLSNMTAAYSVAGTPTTYKVAKQVTIPRLDGKSIWGVGDILEVTQHGEKTGAADVVISAIHIGGTVLSQGDTDTNTFASGFTAAISGVANSLHRRLLRRADAASVSVVTSLSALTDPSIGCTTGSGGNITDVSLAVSLDAATSYVDGTIKFNAVTTDTALVVRSHTVRLISAGAA